MITARAGRELEVMQAVPEVTTVPTRYTLLLEPALRQVRGVKAAPAVRVASAREAAVAADFMESQI
jgi:hypothetical protein